MSVRRVLLYPNKKLREVSEEVVDFESEEFKKACEDLRDTVQAQPAHGLAAPQIGRMLRIFVTQTQEPGELKYFVNPRIVDHQGIITGREGCLSFPTVFENVDRYEDVTITAKNEFGEEFTCDMDDVDSVAAQHELDHLDGVLFIDRVSKLKKRYMLKKLNKYKKRVGITP